ncbi:ABC transporter ATP-binding protein [Anoxynatronum buryatiense]|uniref:Carbohydrate ABC transporter ATP-binding protein, CUT1 family n=1 Tax=Anoxynatronum buryatiense TaxID=489973 RepID=A0AA45WYZ1_9CLOT|nr:sn-glycerol-3-phosphate ABC transporter ATP-binding protein UgpC [Anoxynatronum buryatiense]SMP71179.1 carbohydrate ABC transporter ATP-binding protein, CUT1 family [Anoxynatronum buryatiense]
MASLALKNVTKKYGNTVAVQDFSLDIQDQEFVVFVGPSGCGKSTTLRMIAGLEEITEGDVYIGEARVNEKAPKDRNIAMVFQNYALYPHMTVYENMALGLKNQHVNRDEIHRRILEEARILSLEELFTRKPKELSGGQRQRVAIGRAIVRHPSVFLMDEPLSNLDAKLRVRMRAEIASLHKKLQTTFIYVTHDQTEAMTLGDRIVVMNNRTIQQIGTPDEIYEQPQNLFVAGFIGSPAMNFLEGTLIQQHHTVALQLENQALPLIPHQGKKLLEQVGSSGRVICGIRPEHLMLEAAGVASTSSQEQHHQDPSRQSEGISSSITGEFAGLSSQISLMENMGREMVMHLQWGTDRNLVIVGNRELTFQEGQQVRCQINMEKAHFFDPVAGTRLKF